MGIHFPPPLLSVSMKKQRQIAGGGTAAGTSTPPCVGEGWRSEARAELRGHLLGREGGQGRRQAHCVEGTTPGKTGLGGDWPRRENSWRVVPHLVQRQDDVALEDLLTRTACKATAIAGRSKALRTPLSPPLLASPAVASLVCSVRFRRSTCTCSGGSSWCIRGQLRKP